MSSKSFSNRISPVDIHNALLTNFGVQLSSEELQRLNRIKRNWNFWEGYHWEELPETDKPQVTENYIRAFVDKFVSYELGKGFTVKMKPEIEEIDGENDPLDFINDVWEDNNKLERCIELGQSKSVTGDGWIQVSYEPKTLANGVKNDKFYDPFGEYEKGRMRITIHPTAIVFPKYNETHDKDTLEELVIMYPITTKSENVFRKPTFKNTLYRQVWTRTKVEEFVGTVRTSTTPNKYGVIPFRQIKNFPHQGRNEGVSDIEDLIPLNMELNLKKSDISEVIDYHSAPVTIVFGARIAQLERGANKVWGGLPKDARIENLRLEGDLTAAQNYVKDIKSAMHEVGSIPEGVLGGNLAISNTSGIALQISLKPILDRVEIKHVLTKEGLEEVNKLILLIGEKEKLITVPSGVTRKDFFYNEVSFDSPLPKDSLLELQELELEMRMGLESREGAMKRTGKANIQKKIAEIDSDMEKNPTLYGKEDMEEKLTLMREQSSLQQGNTSLPSTTPSKKVGENKSGQPKQVNAGFSNGPVKK